MQYSLADRYESRTISFTKQAVCHFRRTTIPLLCSAAIFSLWQNLNNRAINNGNGVMGLDWWCAFSLCSEEVVFREPHSQRHWKGLVETDMKNDS
ncbi:hypothetical protein TNCT_373471 [Trichonephila clavata]|uniref:Uncharacterized protein n=1 Tax=Trichonephila clavata TaxID=2740835 RepID=A0A8X6J7F7_TRICU|nr:hypothetical protein TNCT_373471 [Trichonephila clavata]